MLTADDIVALIPAHNEERGIAATVASVRAQGVKKILVMCDNCTDLTEAVAQEAGAIPVATLDNSARKAGALNQGLKLLEESGETKLVLAMDADTVLERGWIANALRVLNARESVGAVGAIFEADSDSGWLRKCQALEWHRYARQALRTGKTFVLSGTAALIRWEALAQVQEKFSPTGDAEWYDSRAITEDFDFSVRLLRTGWKLASPDACRVVTETMPMIKDLFLQRRRWSLGALQTVSRHGFERATAIYWWQQFMLLLSIFSMTLLVVLTVVGIATQTIALSPFWLAVGLIFMVERVVTILGRPPRDILFAALVLPELVYALVVQASHVAALYQFVTGSNGSWHHVEN